METKACTKCGELMEVNPAFIRCCATDAQAEENGCYCRQDEEEEPVCADCEHPDDQDDEQPTMSMHEARGYFRQFATYHETQKQTGLGKRVGWNNGLL